MAFFINDWEFEGFVWDSSIIEHFKDEDEKSEYEHSIKHFVDDDYDAMKEYETHIQHFG